MKKNPLSLLAIFMFFICYAEVKKVEPRVPALELQFGLHLGYPISRVVGQLKNNEFPVFCTCYLGENDNPLIFSRFNTKSIEPKNKWQILSMTISEYEDRPVPIQIRAKETAWLNCTVALLALDFTMQRRKDGFFEVAWLNSQNEKAEENFDKRYYRSNNIIFYLEGGPGKFDPNDIIVKQDLDLVFAPKLFCKNFGNPDDSSEKINDLVFFMRNNTKQKILAIQNQNIVVLATDDKPVMVEGKPFALPMAKATVLKPEKFILEHQSFLDIYSAFAKTTLPHGFYRLCWQVEVEYEDHTQKRFSSNDIWIYHGKYIKTTFVKKNL